MVNNNYVQMNSICMWALQINIPRIPGTFVTDNSNCSRNTSFYVGRGRTLLYFFSQHNSSGHPRCTRNKYRFINVLPKYIFLHFVEQVPAPIQPPTPSPQHLTIHMRTTLPCSADISPSRPRQLTCS